MSQYVKMLMNLERHVERDYETGVEREVVDAGLVVTPPAASVTYCRKLAEEAADALHKVRPDLRAEAALCRVLFRFDPETFSGVFVEQAREAFVARWAQLKTDAA